MARPRLLTCLLWLLAGCVAFALAEKAAAASQGQVVPLHLHLDHIEESLQECKIVQQLNAEKLARHASASTLTQRIFAVLFPGSPAVNALLGTLYISGPPNILLALCPADIDPSSLSILVAFAVGGILGDSLLHLVPEIYLGEDSPDRARFVLVEPNRNLVLGIAILVGFMTFVAIDKGLRIITGGAGHDHGHGHSHAHAKAEEVAEVVAATSSAIEGKATSGAKARKTAASTTNGAAVPAAEPAAAPKEIKMGGILNMVADFTHNITDGLAMAASFYASPTIGATTTLAIACHEIPHEVGDFALLVQSGFTKSQAIGAQFVTALGALLGTLIGIAIQELGGGAEASGPVVGILGTSLTWGDMLLPWTCGTFLYVGTVAVIPELLETGPDKWAEVRKTLVQFAAIAAGAGIMIWISFE